MTTTEEIVDNLRAVLRKTHEEAEREISAVRTRYQARISQLEDVIAQFEGLVDPMDRASQVDLSVGQEKLELVRQYMRQHRRVRQADIHKALGLNSGTVSVALRVLGDRGEIRVLDRKDRGSNVWECVYVAVKSAA